jgi:hypothetical protein
MFHLHLLLDSQRLLLSHTPWSVSPVFVLVSTPLQGSPIFPVIPSVFIHMFVSCPFFLFRETSVFPLAPVCSSSGFLVFTIWPFCLPWPWAYLPFCTFPHHTGLLIPASSDPETACRCVSFAPCLDYWPMPAPVLVIHFFSDNVCIWVLPETWWYQLAMTDPADSDQLHNTVSLQGATIGRHEKLLQCLLEGHHTLAECHDQAINTLLEQFRGSHP